MIGISFTWPSAATIIVWLLIMFITPLVTTQLAKHYVDTKLECRTNRHAMDFNAEERWFHALYQAEKDHVKKGNNGHYWQERLSAYQQRDKSLQEVKKIKC